MGNVSKPCVDSFASCVRCTVPTSVERHRGTCRSSLCVATAKKVSGHCTCSGRPRAWVDRTRAQPRDFTRDMVFVLTNDIRMRQFSTFWTRPHHDCTRSDVSRFRGFCDLVKFELRLCTCVFRSRCVRPSVQRQARRDVVLWNEIGVSAAEMNMRL